MAGTWAELLGLFLILFLIRPFGSDAVTVFKIVVIMGLVGDALQIVSIDTLTDWATDASKAVGATAIAGSLVMTGLNFVIQQADIPFIPDNVEKVMRYVIYAVGGVLMAGSGEWGEFFVDLTGLLAGGDEADGVLGVLESGLNIVTLGLRGG